MNEQVQSSLACTQVISHSKNVYIVSTFFAPPRTQEQAKADMKKIIDKAYNNLIK